MPVYTRHSEDGKAKRANGEVCVAGKRRNTPDAPTPPALTPREPISTEDQILTVSAELFATIGYDGTSTRAIGQACGKSQSVIFHYYPSKSSILGAIAERAMGQQVADIREVIASDRTPSEMLHETVVRHVSAVLSDPPFLRSLLVHQNRRFEAENVTWLKQNGEYRAAFIDIIKAGMRSGEFAKAMPDLAYLAIFSMIHSTANWYRSEADYRDSISEANSLSSESLASELANFALKILR